MTALRSKAPAGFDICEIRSADAARDAARTPPPGHGLEDLYRQTLFDLCTYPVTLTDIGIASVPLAETAIAALSPPPHGAGARGLVRGSCSVGESP